MEQKIEFIESFGSNYNLLFDELSEKIKRVSERPGFCCYRSVSHHISNNESEGLKDYSKFDLYKGSAIVIYESYV
jgi:hypothetical protein